MPPLFMLERQEQWYPPGFLVLCALLPQKLLETRYWLLNHLIDLISAIIIFATSLWFGSDLLWAACIFLTYSMMAGLVNEFTALNVRPFGLLLFNVVMVSAFAVTQDHWLLLLLAPLCVLLFFSHKLSVQQLWFTLPLLSLVTADLVWIGTLVMIYVLPFIVWPRGAWRVLGGHAVIVRFWHRNWTLLGAHAVRQSSVYGDGVTRTDFYSEEGFAAAINWWKESFHQNYFVLPVAGSVLLQDSWIHSDAGRMLLFWIGSVYLWAALIHFFKPLRGIGLGRQYIKFALLPSLVATALSLSVFESPVSAVISTLAAVLTIRQYFLVTRNAFASSSGATAGADDQDLEAVLQHLEQDVAARCLCLPVHLCDLVAWRARRPVYWGSHSDVFDDRLEDFFPVLNRDLQHYVNDGVNRILIDTRYVLPQELGLPEALMGREEWTNSRESSQLAFMQLRHYGPFLLYEVGDGQSGSVQVAS